ncbi:MAG: methionyl-tRNA formyltransferase, partial [Terriglobia bacterium]
QPDRPKGRKLRTGHSSVKQVAIENGVPVFQPADLKTPILSETLSALQPDLGVVVAYGLILPGWILSLFGRGFVNVHASLLPKYRGAAPVQRAIMNGEPETGVTIQRMDEGIDTGDVLAQESLRIDRDDTTGSLSVRLAELGARMLGPTLTGFVSGAVVPVPQDERGVSYAQKITRAETVIDWNRPSQEIRNKVRALNPKPAAYTCYKDRRLQVLEVAELTGDGISERPGTVLDTEPVVRVMAETGVVEITTVRPEGGNLMSGAAFARGHRLRAGEVLG